MTEEVETKRCTNCTRGPQPLDQFINIKNGKITSSCLKCREKGKKYDAKPERKAYHDELMQEKGNGYSQAYREREKNGENAKEHNLEQRCEWSKNPEFKDKRNLWRRLNLNERLWNYKKSAISRELVWELKDEEACEMMLEPCSYCGNNDFEKHINGIDRMVNSIGYTKDNCCSCCKNCNYMKNDLSVSKFIKHCTKFSKCNVDFSHIPIQNEIMLKRNDTIVEQDLTKTDNKKLNYYKRNAKSRNILWELTDQEAEKLLDSDCIFCGESNSIGIDRLDNTKWYSTINCAPCCSLCNDMKKSLDPRSFINQGKAVAFQFMK